LRGRFSTYSFAGSNYQLYTPVTKDLQEAWMSGSLKDFPYWSKCWPSAIALSDFIAKNQALIQDKHVLELAAGLGLPSLVAARFAKNVITSDYLSEPLSFVKISAAENNITNIETRIINWHNQPSDLLVDIVLLSDVNYNPDDFETLDRLFSFFLQQHTLIILSTPQRIMARSFVEKWLPFKTMQEEFMLREGEEEVWVSVLVLERRDRE